MEIFVVEGVVRTLRWMEKHEYFIKNIIRWKIECEYSCECLNMLEKFLQRLLSTGPTLTKTNCLRSLATKVISILI
jgi:hypothetical protein